VSQVAAATIGSFFVQPTGRVEDGAIFILGLLAADVAPLDITGDQLDGAFERVPVATATRRSHLDPGAYPQLERTAFRMKWQLNELVATPNLDFVERPGLAAGDAEGRKVGTVP
jgi:hypothetical protein